MVKKIKIAVIFIVFLILISCTGHFSWFDRPYMHNAVTVLLQKGKVYVQSDSKQELNSENKTILTAPPVTFYVSKMSFLDIDFMRSYSIRLKSATSCAVKRSEVNLSADQKLMLIELYTGTLLFNTRQYTQHDMIVVKTPNYLLQLVNFKGIISSSAYDLEEKINITALEGFCMVYDYLAQNLIIKVNSGKSCLLTSADKSINLSDPDINTQVALHEIDTVARLPLNKKRLNTAEFFNKALYYENKNNFKQAINNYKKALSYRLSVKDRARCHYKIASLYHYSLYDYNNAAFHYKNVVFLDDKFYSAEACLGLSRVLNTVNKKALANYYLKKILILYPHSQAAVTARNLLSTR